MLENVWGGGRCSTFPPISTTLVTRLMIRRRYNSYEIFFGSAVYESGWFSVFKTSPTSNCKNVTMVY